MKLNNLHNKKIGILGLGVENQALVFYLLKRKIECQIVICDSRNSEELKDRMGILKNYKNISWKLGKNYDENLGDFDILFRSPGYPLFSSEIARAKKSNKKLILSSAMSFFLDLCPSKNVIGVTGTKGKGTTSSLIAAILFAAGKKTWLAGNIGLAPFSFLSKIKSNDWIVLELSSFQLEDMSASPHISVITNFSREHLAPADPLNPNYHKSIKSYRDAKKNIFAWQGKNDYLVINKKLKKSNFDFSRAKGGVIFFDKSQLQSKLIGEHNKENIAAAVSVAKILKIKDEIIPQALKNFKGLEHRLEFVCEIEGIKYYNDTFATTPESAITALKSFESPIILIAGGADKGSDFSGVVREIKKRVKFLVLLSGKATPRIKRELLKIGYSSKNMKIVESMKEAVELAKGFSQKGDVVLLSPACASFGMFRNYKERGIIFKEEVNKLK